MSNMIKSVLQQDVALGASTTLDPIILPVNPLSFITFTLRALNNTAVLTDYSFIRDFMAFVTNLEVRFKGHTIIGGRLQDLAMLNALMHGFKPVQGNVGSADGDSRMVTFIISFSRRPYWREEAFPAVRSGELTLHITSGALPAGLVGFTIQIETTELLGVQPMRFMKYTTQARAFSTTGNNDLDLPIGNPILGILVFGTTVPSGVSFNATGGQMRILVDNVETDYASVNWESLHGELGMRLKSPLSWQGHFHDVDAAGVGEEDTREMQLTPEVVDNYAFIDFDPLMDGSYQLPTAGKSRVQLRVNADVADTMRILPLELFQVSALPQAGRPGV